MIIAYIGEREVIPYDSVEFVEPTDRACIVHMGESKKEYPLLPRDAEKFMQGYKDFLTLKEAIMGVVTESDQPESRRKK